MPCNIDDPDKIIELIYIDELIDIFMENLSIIPEKSDYVQLNPVYKVNLNDLFTNIKFFNSEKLSVDFVGAGFKSERAGWSHV